MINRPPIDNQRPFGADAEVTEESQEDGVPASEEEQAQYDLIVSRAVKYMYGKGKEDVLKTLGSGESPAQSIGLVASRIARIMKQSATDQGTEFGDEVLYQAGAEIVEELSELGQEAGVFQFNDENEAQEQTEEGMLWAMKYWGEDAKERGELDQQAAQQAMQEGLMQEQGNPMVAQGVNQALQPKPSPGIIGQAMGGM